MSDGKYFKDMGAASLLLGIHQWMELSPGDMLKNTGMSLSAQS